VKEPVINPLVLFFVVLCFATISFYFYGPANPLFFNSDQAIHVLMALDFNWPEDAYYWGQNRLGSLLPLVSMPFVAFKSIHPICVLGLFNYCFLVAGFCFIHPHIKSIPGKLFFLFALFFPHPSYHYQLLMGHPYAGQFFAISCSIWFYLKLLNHFSFPNSDWNLRAYVNGFFAFFFALMAVWVSELSLMLFVAYFYHLFNLKWWRKPFSILFAILSILLGVWLLIDLKVMAVSDPKYNEVFLGSVNEINQQWQYFFEQFMDVVLIAKHHSSFQCYYYYFLVFSILFMLYHKRKIDLLLGIILATCILLFFSKWNYRSNFDPKYFTPIMLLSMFWIARQLSAFRFSPKWFLVAGLVVSLGVSTVDYIASTRSSENTFEQYAGIEKLPAGLVFGNYWQVYRLSAVSSGSISGVSIADWDFRNKKNLNHLAQYKNAYLTAEAVQVAEENLNQIHGFKFLPTTKIYLVGFDTLYLMPICNSPIASE